MEDSYGYSRPDGWESDPEIAIIPITGVIMPKGLSQSQVFFGGGFSAGSKTIVGQINRAADDESSQSDHIESGLHLKEEVLLPPIKSGGQSW